jgi:heme oxygenase
MTAGQANRYSVKGDEEMNEINLNFRQIEEENPYLLIAYIYHLYMGLFSGGQVLTAKVFSRFICKY